MKDFIEQAILTEAPVTDEVKKRWGYVCREMHAAMGMCTEAGELQDAYKKYVFYGKAYDTVNIKEEIGDLLWYVALLCKCLGVSIEEIMERVIAKLRKRYGDKFTEYDALYRDLKAERKELEGSTSLPNVQMQETGQVKIVPTKMVRDGIGDGSGYQVPAPSKEVIQTWIVDTTNLPGDLGFEDIQPFYITAVSADSALHKATLRLLQGKEYNKPNEEFPSDYQSIRSSLEVTKSNG